MLARTSKGEGLTKRFMCAYSQPASPANSAAVTNSDSRTR
jgi:hypothetical protein